MFVHNSTSTLIYYEEIYTVKIKLHSVAKEAVTTQFNEDYKLLQYKAV
jgi:hypothetical protein